jgi:hypothetical protein
MSDALGWYVWFRALNHKGVEYTMWISEPAGWNRFTALCALRTARF